MNRERWGTFSVRDHTNRGAFATDVLMYDRLIIPRPADAKERSEWADRQWQPQKLETLLEVLGERAITVPWNGFTRELFKQRAAAAKIVDEEANYGLTRRLLAADLLPGPPAGVSRVSVVTAYPSSVAAEEEWVDNSQMNRERVTIALSHRLLVPERKQKTDVELLREAVELASDSDFRAKRAQMYSWLDEVVRLGMREDDALDEMSQYVEEYNAATKKAVKAVQTKFVFTLIPVGLAALGGPLGTAAAVGAVANLVRFWIFDRTPVVQAREAEVAAMFHTAQAELGWKIAR